MDFNMMVEEMRATFISGKTRTREWRLSQLQALVTLIDENTDRMCEALHKDLHKNKVEAIMVETLLCRNDAISAMNKLDEWMKPQKVDKPIMYKMDNAYIQKEPLGVSLIIGAWNYPVQLTLLPLIGALAAGNCCILKPSELSPATAAFLEEYIPKYLDSTCVKVVNGGVPETTALLKEKFDIILYTGNSNVAKIVMAAAAKFLTPVILELGGKSPVYVDRNMDFKTVGKRVAWGKYMNCGQTCVAPDYLMCPPDIQEDVISGVKSAIEEFFTKDPKSSDCYGRMINPRHFERVSKLIDSVKPAVGGDKDEKDKFIAPTILKDVKLSDAIMQEEIFGPILPVVPVKDHKEAIEIINSREKPLALYVFSNNNSLAREISSRTSSGAFLVNDTVVHGGLCTLPFGGVGNSGMGSYHGKFSFDAFSHSKAVMEKSLSMEAANSLRYPPYTEKKLGWIQWAMTVSRKKSGISSFLPFVVMGAVLGLLYKAVGVAALRNDRK